MDADIALEAARPSDKPASRWRRVALLALCAVVLSHAADSRTVARLDASVRVAERARFARRGFGGPRLELGTPQPGRRLAPVDVKTFGDEPFYDVKVLRTIFIQFPATNWEALLEPNYRSDIDVPASVIIDGKAYREVGVRFRGNSSYRMVPSGFKRSLNLSFDAVHADQTVGGYNTLNLLNANGDPTFVRTILYSEIARQYVAAPKVNFVRVVINGESWGIFVNVQQFNKDFVRESYGTAKGVRWKVPGSPRGRGGLEYLGDGVASYRNLYELKSKESDKEKSDKAWTDLIRLCRLLNNTAPEHLEAVLAPHLDIDEALKFLAVEVALVNTDGYWTRASDYSIYQEENGRFHVLPYDFNEAMGVESPGRRGGFGHGGPTLDPLVGADDVSKPLRARLLAVPALRERYLRYVHDIADKWLDWRVIEPRVNEYQTLIEADVKADGRKLYSVEAFNPSALEAFFRQRREYLLQ
jgi:hypothetical protein